MQDAYFRLDEWLNDAYARNSRERFCGELDACYDGWNEIETFCGRLFDSGQLRELTGSSLERLLFFISRNDECGRILAWMSCQMPYTWVGQLTYDDFIFLCENALAQEVDDCDFQLVACFLKHQSLAVKDQEILKSFMDRNHDYCRGMVIDVFGKFQLPETIKLIEKHWETTPCELQKLGCLKVLSQLPNANTDLMRYFQEYMAEYDVHAEEYRKSHINNLFPGQKPG